MKYLILLFALLLPAVSSAGVAQIVVPVTLTYQGKSVTVPMAVDTGASFTTIDNSVADRLGVATCTGSGLAQLADGTAVNYCSVSMDVSASTMAKRDLQVNIMDYRANSSARGMLGLNFLSDKTMTLDWKNRRLYWSE